MGWKEFFKINWVKLGITLIATLLLIFFTKIPAWVIMRSGASEIQLVKYSYFLSHFTKQIYFNYEIFTFLIITLEIAIIYVISCFINRLIKE